jgi:glycosyltransferase involved in cell wall biosynthesis
LDQIMLSIVVPTRNRADQLERCLDAARAMDGNGWELIVVDNGSTDRTPEILASRAGEFAHFRSVTVAEPGAGRARNGGLALAAGPLVAFFDDDCYPTPSYALDVVAEFGDDPEIGFVAGRILLHDPDDLPITIETSEVARAFAPRSYLAGGAVHTANFAARTDALRAAGGFDPRLGPGTGLVSEDVEAAARVLWAGFSGKYSPVPTVYHHHGRRDEQAAKQLFVGYARGRGAYIAKFVLNPESRWTYLKALPRHVAGVIRHSGFRQLRDEAIGAWKWIRLHRAGDQ